MRCGEQEYCPITEDKIISQDIICIQTDQQDIPNDIELQQIYALLEKNGDDQIGEKIIRLMLEKAGYNILQDRISLFLKQRAIIAIVHCKQGKKFLKLVEQGCGQDEYDGGVLLSQHCPTIRAEKLINIGNIALVVQPLMEQISTNTGMLTDVIALLENTKNQKMRNSLWRAISAVFEAMEQLTANTLQFTIQPAKNDRFFYNRLKTERDDGEKGRIESFYSGKSFNLKGIEIPWESLIQKQWIVDGTPYQESLSELIRQARQVLDPKKPRLIAMSHGDGHEMNIYSNATDPMASAYHFAFLDLETAGNNFILGEAVGYLVYNSIMADYTVPKYYPEHFSERNSAMNMAITGMKQKIRSRLEVRLEDGKIIINGLGNFGTNATRKEIGKQYIAQYIEPIITMALSRFGQSMEQAINETIRAAFVMRLIGVHNIQLMDTLDQVKLLGLVYKTCGSHPDDNKSALTKFLEAI